MLDTGLNGSDDCKLNFIKTKEFVECNNLNRISVHKKSTGGFSNSLIEQFIFECSDKHKFIACHLLAVKDHTVEYFYILPTSL